MKTQFERLTVKQIWSLSALITFSALTALPGLAVAVNTCNQFLEKAPEQVENFSIENYLQNHKKEMKGSSKRFHVEKLKFLGTDGRDVYNPAPPFDTTIDGQPIRILLGRVEPRENHESEVWFFTESAPGVLSAVEGLPKLKMEDPFWSLINGELVMGGVETYPDPHKEGQLAYRTVFFRDGGKGVDHLERFAVGPDRMKDIRLLQLADNSILVATRPQGPSLETGGRGRVGLTYIKSLEELTPSKILQARIIHNQVAQDEWLGVNQMHLLENGDVLFVAHVARYDMKKKVDVNGRLENPRDYYGAVFTLSNLTPKVYIERKDIDNLKGSAKRNDLLNVLFNGGWVNNGDGTATAYLGMGDSEAVRVTFKTPFFN